MHPGKQVILALAIFVPWLTAMVTVQVSAVSSLILKRTWRWLLFWKRWDIFYLCPTFSFFSWLPTSHYHLLIRDLYPGGEWSGWRLTPLPRRTGLRFLWNPARRVRFALEDAAKALLAHLGAACALSGLEPGAHTLDCFAYRYLASFTLQQPGSPLTLARQFMIARAGNAPPAREGSASARSGLEGSGTGAAARPPAPLFVSLPLPCGPRLDPGSPRGQSCRAGLVTALAGEL